VTGLAPNGLVRIVRSRSLLAKAGPYYPFPSDSTVVAIRVTENPSGAPLANARALITKVNTLALSSTIVGGVKINHTLSPPAAGSIILGRDEDLRSFSDARGNLVFYCAGAVAITALEVELSHTGHITANSVLPVTAGTRNGFVLSLSPS
jgi:hypothetical protein